ncbi:monovalent cation/H(+) antiporter subunit G [Nocardioides sp. zg-536]|uniref:Monovalent cation/H(+) antiporter subunit G n=1 Tax=Nocardioides faecalis TaxID=2803858 RepID=A0A939BVP2_9ACTN|nr:monovalent cation/H(+) antiporter subunit G [Nocardioides faecalis]MBM9460166.1 monovalent cation/H(+) antiporter subunit G [Nocardioides faecalis]MBS4754265.1 monovalent cation/H(+) antiporter subunit G [Nocardioides faecalis]QVI60039.1 monovalent cation/H(+) antiporter subunit G [Nocardioides faecalis]
MTWAGVADTLAAICFLLGATLAMIAAIGVLRLPDLLSRMHAATKPQSLGLVLVLMGLALRAREADVIGLLTLVGVFQLLTTPVANHMLGRASLRAGQVRDDLLVVDDLADAPAGHEEPRGAP